MMEIDFAHSCSAALLEAADGLLESYAKDGPMFLGSE